jgi:hypothetical protein
MLIKGTMAALAMAAGLAGSAMGSTVSTTFDFTGLTGRGQTFTASSGGVDLVVDGARYTGAGAILGNAAVTWTAAGGLGAKTGRTDDNARLDGNGPNEILQFLFSKIVTIEQVTFAAIARNSVSDTFVGGTRTATGQAVAASVDYSLASLVTDWFGIGARADDAAFRISSITVSWEEPDAQGPSAVPVPAGGLMLVSGLGAIGLIRRKRKAG